MNSNRQSILEHLNDLRTCLIRSLLSLTVGMGISLYFSKEIFQILQRPLTRALPKGSSFIATGPVEAMVTYLKVGLLAGIFLASPLIFYFIWRFVAPGLHANERKWTIAFVVASSLFFIGGALFGYFVVFPMGFKFFVATLVGTDILFFPKMESYLGFVSKMLFSFGLVFELPVILVILAKVGIVSHRALSKARRYVIVLAFLVAGILTPGPDVLSQFLLAVPLLVLYEVSLLAVRLLEKRSSA